MSRLRLLAVLRSLRPEEHADSDEYRRRLRIEWRVLRALERGRHLRPLRGRAWTRAEILAEAVGEPPPSERRLRPVVLVVDADANGEHDTMA